MMGVLIGLGIGFLIVTGVVVWMLIEDYEAQTREMEMYYYLRRLRQR